MPHVVLIIDDHGDTRQMLCRYLGRMGFRVISCEGAESALEAMRVSPPDAAILDEGMPGLTGSELFEQMKAEPVLSRVPVIFYSAHFDNAIVARALTAGATDWLVKGVHGLDRLTKAIHSAIAGSQTN